MKMLDAIKEGFNHVAGAIQRAVMAALGNPMRTWRNDGFCSRGANGLHKIVGVVALVSDDRLRAQVFNQFSRAPGGAATGHLAAHEKGCHRGLTATTAQVNLDKGVKIIVKRTRIAP